MKKLSQMTLEELWQLFPIILREHNTNYIQWYKTERDLLLKTIDKDVIARISHIGSTAVKGLIAKPTVDILLEILPQGDMAILKEKLLARGWLLMSESDSPYRTMIFNKGYTEKGFAEKVYHLHVRSHGDWDELYFRDYLIAHREVAIRYGELKLRLIEKYRHDRDGYTEAKSSFIAKHTKKAREEYKNRYNTVVTDQSPV